jgi:hypothetical protein
MMALIAIGAGLAYLAVAVVAARIFVISQTSDIFDVDDAMFIGIFWPVALLVWIAQPINRWVHRPTPADKRIDAEAKRQRDENAAIEAANEFDLPYNTWDGKLDEKRESFIRVPKGTSPDARGRWVQTMQIPHSSGQECACDGDQATA